MLKKIRLASLGVVSALLLLVQNGAAVQSWSSGKEVCSETRSGPELAAAWFPTDGQLQWEAGRWSLEQGAWGQAICYLGRAQSLLRPNASLLLDLGDALHGSGDSLGAVQHWAAASALDPQSEGALRRLRAAYQAAGQWQDLARVLQGWLSLHPQDTSAQVQLAEVSAALDPQKAWPLIRGLEQGGKEPNSNLRQLETTIQEAEQEGGSAYAYARVGEWLLQREQWSLAETALQEAVRLNPDYGEAFAYLGLALEQSAQPAEEAYRRGVALAPQDGTVHLLYGSYLTRRGEISQARQELQQSWDLGPKAAVIASELGSLEYSAGNLAAAQQWYAQGVQLFPNDEGAWIAEAEFYVGHNLEVEQAGIPAARQATILAPGDPHGVDLLGFGWFLLGDVPTAERLFWRAIAEDPTYVPAYFHLGLVAESDQEFGLAVGFYRQVISLEPQGSTAQAAKERMVRIGVLP
jgi:tetratricopeptide (TPR) repeat protein